MTFLSPAEPVLPNARAVPSPLLPSAPPMGDDGDQINLLEILDVIIDNRWLIAAVTAVAIVAGVTFAMLSTPIYEANTLIQVEDTKPGGANLLGDVGSMFDIKSPASAEIEILRSRLVIGQAVANLKLDMSVRPRYVPIFGRWLSQRATEPSNPGFMGFSGYVSGTEDLQVAALTIPSALEYDRFTVALTTEGYELRASDGKSLGNGRIGVPMRFQHRGLWGTLLVASAVGKPGAEFYVTQLSRLAVTEGLQRSLSIVELGKQSGVIRSSLDGTDPLRIANTLNEIGSLFVRQNIERKAAEAEKSLVFLNTQLPQLRKELEASEEKFNAFRNQKGVFDLSDEAKALLEQAVTLRVNLLALQQKREELATRFTSAHPSIQVLDTQIKQVSSQIGAMESRAKTFPNVEQDLLRLTRDVKVNNELYTSLLNSFQQLRLVKEGKVGSVRVVDIAAVPESSIKPQRQFIEGIATVFGLFLGLVLAFIRNSLRPGLKDPSDIESRLGLHVFATVPHSETQLLRTREMMAKKPGNHVLAVLSPQDPVVESLRSLRTALQFVMLDVNSNIVAITGPTPGIGKSFCSVNFAVVLAAANKKVLLIDGDLRKGHLNQYFGFSRERGFSENVSGTVAFGDAVHRDVAPNLDFLSTGILPPNPAELLISPNTQALMQQLSTQYDLIIIDCPPVLETSDAAILGLLAGAVFMVARAEVTSLGELQESSRRLAQSGVQARGVVFNDLNMTKRRYGYSYGMGYKYGKYRYTDYRY